jgi:hypothetical protein
MASAVRCATGLKFSHFSTFGSTFGATEMAPRFDQPIEPMTLGNCASKRKANERFHCRFEMKERQHSTSPWRPLHVKAT